LNPLLRITTPEERLPLDDDGEGFVHLSRPDQVLTPANAMFRARTDCRLLVLDPARLGTIRVEGGFPHLYGTLAAGAVIDDVALLPDDDGAFRLALVPLHSGSSPGADLVRAMVDELVPLYGRIDGSDAPTASPDDMWRPAGVYLVGWDDRGAVVCGGGIKRLDDATAEIKRMFVVPGARGRGHARRLLRGLESAARDLGYERVRLDTGAKQPHALALYPAAGYVEIPDYNGNPHASYWGEKRL
jgi:uncharacterized protein (DUF952 family)/GNAT superfamily N-acetyltransferase